VEDAMEKLIIDTWPLTSGRTEPLGGGHTLEAPAHVEPDPNGYVSNDPKILEYLAADGIRRVHVDDMPISTMEDGETVIVEMGVVELP
jgi:hypothetical protein